MHQCVVWWTWFCTRRYGPVAGTGSGLSQRPEVYFPLGLNRLGWETSAFLALEKQRHNVTLMTFVIVYNMYRWTDNQFLETFPSGLSHLCSQFSIHTLELGTCRLWWQLEVVFTPRACLKSHGHRDTWRHALWKLPSYLATQWTKSWSMENERRGTGQLILVLTLHLFANTSFASIDCPYTIKKRTLSEGLTSSSERLM